MSASRKVALLAMFAVFAGMVYAAATVFRSNVHPVGVACRECHLAGDVVNRGNASLLVADQERLCSRCHEYATQMSHPSGFSPKVKIPGVFPLDWKGDLTCSTCHDIHGDSPGLLRGNKRGRDLCESCHDRNFFDRMRDGGVSMLKSGHLDDGGNSSGVELDSYSLQCMGCHSGVEGVRQVEVGQNLVVRHAGSSGSHPVGASYVQAENTTRLRPKSMLSESILLPDGRVSCVSCHLAFTQKHGALVMSNQGSQLCFQCHDL